MGRGRFPGIGSYRQDDETGRREGRLHSYVLSLLDADGDDEERRWDENANCDAFNVQDNDTLSRALFRFLLPRSFDVSA